MTLREARELAKIPSQSELARRVGLDSRTISAYENGTRVPPGWRVRDIENALGVAPGSIDWPRPEGENACS